MQTINIIGAGKVARVLGRLWHEAGVLSIQQVMNRSLASSREAVEFMGAGDAVSGWHRFRPADFWMIGTLDDAIWSSANELSQLEVAEAGQVVFHLSGARVSSALLALSDKGLHVASLHPIKSFPDPSRGYESFSDCWCALEGDDYACKVLERHLEAISGQSFRVQAEHKMLYHAGNAMLSNYLLTLMDLGLKMYQLAGIPRDDARSMIGPLMTDTLKNGLEMGPETALTGPIVRCDVDILRSHFTALPPFATELYRDLGLHAIEMAHAAGRLDDEQHRELLLLFNQDES